MTQNPETAPLLPNTSIHSHSTSKLGTPRISFPSASTSSMPVDGASGASPGVVSGTTVGWTSSSRVSKSAPPEEGVAPITNRKEGIPKLTLEYLWSEAKCYGSYILPVLFIFGVCGVGFALLIVAITSGWLGSGSGSGSGSLDGG